MLSFDEKPGIQAVSTTSEDLMPDADHGTRMRDYEYRRRGTLSLLAGIDLQTGEAIPLVSETHNSGDYVAFLKILDAKYPKGDRIRIVLDNLRVHTSQETRRYLATVPGRFEFVFTPKHGSWLNMVEGFFSKMTRQMLRGIRVESKEELKEVEGQRSLRRTARKMLLDHPHVKYIESGQDNEGGDGVTVAHMKS